MNVALVGLLQEMSVARLQIASDLHHEIWTAAGRVSLPLDAEPTADVMVLAGDIRKGTESVAMYADCPSPVVYVHGNHEFYGRQYPELVEKLVEISRGTSVRFLQNTRVVIAGIRFLGTCMWTDYCLFATQVEESVEAGRKRLNDYKFIISIDDRSFQPEDVVANQREALDWLTAELDQELDGKAVVVTHHAPSGMSIPERSRDHALGASFVTNLERLAPTANLWVHGHIHASSDYFIGGCRVVCDPRSYPGRIEPRPLCRSKTPTLTPTNNRNLAGLPCRYTEHPWWTINRKFSLSAGPSGKPVAECGISSVSTSLTAMVASARPLLSLIVHGASE